MTSKPLFRTRLLLLCLACSLALLTKATAQFSISDSSGLGNPSFVREKIKEIDDADLWNALDLEQPGLEKVRESVREGNWEQAARAWSAYWSAKKQPVYLTSMDHLLIDTDLLMPVEEFRKEALQSATERKMIIARADLVMQNKIRTWGDNVVDFGDTVDFNRELGQSGIYGFHYWIWSRPLIMAWAITRDEKYLAKFDQLFQWWYEQRNSITRTIPEFDVVYYELGLGIRNRSFVEHYLSSFSKRSTESHTKMLKTFLASGRWLYELEKWEGYRPGNFQIHGSFMLTQLGLVFSEFRESAQWRRVGLQRMLEHLERDFFSDGAHSERSPRNYTLATYMSYRNLAFLLSAYNVEQAATSRIYASMGRTLEWWKSILTPTGEIPAINDSHRGLFPVRVMKDGTALFGKEGQTSHRHLSRHMPESGFTVMRSDSTQGALYMLLNYGPFAGFHTHYDLLDFELYAFGQPLAVDAGLGLTYDDPLYPDWYRSSRAHNMVAVNDSNIERKGFQGENIKWGSTSSVDYFAGEQQGYRRFGVMQRRQIAFVKPSYWFVLDDLQCKRSGDTLSWYLHSPTTLTQTGHGFSSTSAPGIYVLPAGPQRATRAGTGTAASTSDKTPGKTEQIGWVRFDQVSSKDSVSQFPILLFPFEKQGTVPKVTRISPQHYTVQGPESTDHLFFTNGAYSDTILQTDGSFVLIREGQDLRWRFAIVNGTYLKYRTKTVWTSDSVNSGEGEIP